MPSDTIVIIKGNAYVGQWSQWWCASGNPIILGLQEKKKRFFTAFCNPTFPG